MPENHASSLEPDRRGTDIPPGGSADAAGRPRPTWAGGSRTPRRQTYPANGGPTTRGAGAPGPGVP